MICERCAAFFSKSGALQGNIGRLASSHLPGVELGANSAPFGAYI